MTAKTKRDDRRMRLIACLALSGCSAIFMERLPDDHHAGQPAHCTASKGFVAWDGVLVVADVVSAIASFSLIGAAQDLGQPTGLYIGVLVASVADAAIHTASGISGSKWADECREARGFADRAAPIAAPVTVPASAPVDPDERKTVHGERALYCASASPDVGQCWLDEAQCTADLERAGVPSCERKLAGSCFNATKTLDGSKSGVCAVSIKDCEARREAFAKDPDYSVTRCGVYRVEERR